MLPGPISAAVRALLAVAILVDVYLAWVSLSGGAVAGCGPASNCHTVLNSRWAYWLGIPVSAPALLVYGSLLGATFFLNPSKPPESRRAAWRLMIGCAAAVIGAAVWFVALQLFVIKTICPFCMTAHACGLAAALLVLANAPVREAPRKAAQAAQQVFVTRARSRKLYFAAAGAVGVLVAGQVIHQPATYTSSPIVAGVTTTNATGQFVRQFEIFDGQFKFDLRETPLLGSPEAPHTMVSLFDYTCHHCRQMHGPLMEAHQRFSNQLAIISLPMPLDSKCNPVVRRTLPPHTNACALARIGLTVWTANRSAAPKFDDWVFAPATPPLPEEAERYARELVGVEAFNRAATNRWVSDQIRQDVDIFQAVYRKYRKGAMPAMIIGTNLLSGVFSRDLLFETLGQQFGLPTK